MCRARCNLLCTDCLTPPDGGMLSLSDFLFDGSVATYLCSDGLTQTTRTCHATSGWDYDAISCGKLATMYIGTFTLTFTHAHIICKFVMHLLSLEVE